MDQQSFKTAFIVTQAPQQVFDAINNVQGWWTENLTGSTDRDGDEFDVQFGDIHYSRQKLVELIPAKRVEWLVTDSKLNFTKQPDEWTNTRISFDIEKEGPNTKMTFTHHGLVPAIECYSACKGAWTDYVQSLRSLIETCKGQPAKKE